ncbi:hypothetical protein D3H65_04940 [Paraflavitalea soli]|uniref:Aminoglycoside phosphotransferase domain-containing protein n=1 Tax=Paraflavitalea soli TaxID=2315862 RepID=A0A3B7MG82_9BACT|nr:phosphotransferase [Paraflavitalea soli]AXY73364.1 hypothetical protein D3H65_04940 [Paraflavitalea soli]
MAIFPTQYSTLSAPALGKAIENLYGFSPLICRYLLRGVSDTYKLEGEAQRYIFKIYRDAHRSLEEIKGEVELLNALQEGGAPVSHPIRDLEGGQIQSFEAAEGTRYGVLFSYAAGKPVGVISDEQITNTGRAMARVHDITSTIQLSHARRSYNHQTTLLGPIAALAPAFHELPDEYQYLQDTAAAIIQKLEGLDTSNFAVGYCHFDFLPKNFHIDEQNQVTFFDFDFAGKGYLVNDLMTYWTHFAVDVILGKSTREQSDRAFQVFLSAYRETRPVSAAEEQAIPLLNLGFWVFYLGFHYDQFDDFSTHFFTTRFLKERVALIKKIMDQYCF